MQFAVWSGRRRGAKGVVNYFNGFGTGWITARDGDAANPCGSGPVEATCRQCRFKRPGQFWSQTGDEALLCLETFWRNNRFQHLLFPHTSFDPAQTVYVAVLDNNNYVCCILKQDALTVRNRHEWKSIMDSGDHTLDTH